MKTIITAQTCQLCGNDTGEFSLSWAANTTEGKRWRHFCRSCLSDMAEAYFCWTYHGSGTPAPEVAA